MSSQKKPSFWQRLKHLLTVQAEAPKDAALTTQSDSKSIAPSVKTIEQTCANNEDRLSSSRPEPKTASSDKHPTLQSENRETFKQVADAKGHYSSRRSTADSYPQSPREDASAKFISLSNLDEADNMKLRTASFQNSDNPITDSILDFLEASELSYYYHDPVPEDEFKGDTQEVADVPTGNQTQKYQGDISKRNVHHISMAMRYYQQENRSDTSKEDSQPPLATASDDEQGVVEWGCVIRVHEHTQLVAFYGILPFQLPESHLQAGMTLATQLNYDMMLGCVEIDIRDGEIRFKNSLDLEPIINASGGMVPANVISYLLKGVMAMTASFAPLFSDLIASDPQDFELETLLDEINKAQMDRTFFLATQVRQ